VSLQLINSEEGITFLVKYYPYWIYPDGEKKKNPLFNNDSSMVLNLKNRQEVCLNYFHKHLSPLILNKPVIAVVPSHDPEKKQSGIRDLSKLLINKNTVVDGTNCLKRKDKISKLSGGGNRSKKVHKESIIVENAELIKDNDVFLLDDVTTTGNSLLACKELLLEAGAKSVHCCAIGKTHWD